MEGLAQVNGVVGPLAEATISINDRGCLFGDGVYEVVRVYGGRLFAFARHWRRLERSLAALAIGPVDLSALATDARELLAAAGYLEAFLYVQISRGSAVRSHVWEPEALVPNVILTVRPAEPVPAAAQAAGVACVIRPDIRWHRCDIKSLNLLANVLAKQSAAAVGAYEALLQRPEGTITEGSSNGICLVRDGVVLAHPEDTDVLPSITREIIFELAAELGYPTREAIFDRATLLAADEVFLCGTAAEVLAVREIDGEPIGDGRPGPVTRALAEAYRQAILADRP